MERLRPLDSMFLDAEDGLTHMHIASCAIFERPAPAYDELVALMQAKLPLLPRYRQVVRSVPFGAPVWVDDPHFNLAYHLRHTALPSPGGDEELNTLMGRLMAVELDRHRPLWEAWMVEGLTGGRWAIISKVHHCMVDGVSGTDLMVSLLDSTRHSPPPTPEPWFPGPTPSRLAMMAGGVAAQLGAGIDQMRAAGAKLRTPGPALRTVSDTIQGLATLLRELQPAPQLSIEGPIGPHRRWATARTYLDEIKAIRDTLGGTVNDVVLTVIAGAFRDLLLARGEAVDGAVLRTLVPVSVRAPGDTTNNNQVSMIIAELPIGVEDAAERLAEMRRRMQALKETHQVEAAKRLFTLAEAGPAPLYSMLVRGATAVLRRFPQRGVNTVTTNVPGPQYPLYALGREMLEYQPFVPLSQGVRIGIAILSYNGQVSFGVTGDYDTMPEVEWFCRRIEANTAELATLAEQARGTLGPGRNAGARRTMKKNDNRRNRNDAVPPSVERSA